MQGEHMKCVIVGASHAGAQVAVSLRQKGWVGSVTLISDEYVFPYHRPPLSKDLLSGAKAPEDVLIRPAAAYRKLDVRLLLGARVESMRRQQRELVLDDGQVLSYDWLVLATGAKPRQLPIAGADLPGVFYLRSMADVQDIKSRVGPERRAVIIGGGYIGLETAASLTKLGVKVTILEAMDRVLERVTTRELSEFFTRVHVEEGVSIVTNASVSRIEGDDSVRRVVCADGEEYEADLVIIGIGVQPSTDLAQDAGLEVDNGIKVDEFARTSDETILAAGDCTNHHNPIYDRNIRLESVQNASDQAKVVAATICGDLKSYRALPWFWSDQYDVKLQIAGLNQGFDRAIIRGNTDTGRSFAVFYLKQNKLLAVDAINKPSEFLAAKKLIVSGEEIDIRQLADSSIAIKDLC